MTSEAGAHARLRVDITHAARLVAPLWPVERFIAVNPLMGLVDQGFERATALAGRWLGSKGYPARSALGEALRDGRVDDHDLRTALVEHGVDPDHTADLLQGADPPVIRPPRTVLERVDARHGTDLAARADREVGRWCALLVSDHGLPFAPSGPGGYAAWRRLAPGDRRLRRMGSTAALRRLPEGPADAVLGALDILGVRPESRVEELRGQLARLPGWAGYARWCDEWAEPDDPAPRLGLLDLLAIRLSIDALARPSGPVPGTALFEDPSEGRRSAARCSSIALTAMETGFRRRLLSRLDHPETLQTGPPEAQAVFCIDARSEGLRRHLESVGRYATIGFAGFFAVPLRYRAVGSTEAYPSAPVLLAPTVEVGEVAVTGAEDQVQQHVRADWRRADLESTSESVAHGPLSMFAMAEAAGWVLGPRALVRTLWPQAADPGPSPGTRVTVGVGDDEGFSLEERVLVAETALRTMGLTVGFAPIVLLCGHRSTSTANPHAATLDCGACGGNRGGPNARAAAAILNDPQVRAELAERGIAIPAGTWFVAGEHDTTTDRVVVLDADQVPDEHGERVAALVADLCTAGERQASDRLERLPGAAAGRSRREVRARAGDWAQTRPEWGLAGNAAFIVAPRARTQGIDLEGRCFLHSYDPDGDRDGTALETILTAPMVVAHWINAQYYCSTVDPDVHGAGDKVLHNPLPGVGVLLGAGGDLKAGLPRQSVMDGDRLYHEPLRLLTVVEAPIERIDAVVDRNPVLQQLFDGAWVHLVAFDAITGTWSRRRTDGVWITEPTNVPPTGGTRPEEVLT